MNWIILRKKQINALRSVRVEAAQKPPYNEAIVIGVDPDHPRNIIVVSTSMKDQRRWDVLPDGTIERRYRNGEERAA